MTVHKSQYAQLSCEKVKDMKIEVILLDSAANNEYPILLALLLWIYLSLAVPRQCIIVKLNNSDVGQINRPITLALLVSRQFR
jgi:hypothetical protein